MPQNCRNQEHNLERKYFSRGVVTKINLLPVETYKVCAPPPVPFITVVWYFVCTTESISARFVRRKKKITAGKLHCQVIDYCTLGHTGNLRQKGEFSISEPVHCCKGKKQIFLGSVTAMPVEKESHLKPSKHRTPLHHDITAQCFCS